MMNQQQLASTITRRQMLSRCGMGFGALGLAGLLAPDAARAVDFANPLAPRFPHYPARAKRVISLRYESIGRGTMRLVFSGCEIKEK